MLNACLTLRGDFQIDTYYIYIAINILICIYILFFFSSSCFGISFLPFCNVNYSNLEIVTVVYVSIYIYIYLYLCKSEIRETCNSCSTSTNVFTSPNERDKHSPRLFPALHRFFVSFEGFGPSGNNNMNMHKALGGIPMN